MPTHPHCFICGQPGAGYAVKGALAHGVVCRICGTYEISELATDLLRGSPDLMPGLSAYVRNANLRDETPVLSTDTWEAYAKRHRNTPVAAKLDRLLKHLEKQTKHRGSKVGVDGSKDYPLFDAATSSEVGYLLSGLVNRGDLDELSGGNHVITPAGWDRLTPPGGRGEPGACFVAMASDPKLSPLYDECIQPVVSGLGFTVIRVDRVEHNGNINDLIIAELRRCQFLIADFTFQRYGVYFEAGYAMALGREVVFTCRADEFTKGVHFDTRPYNHIRWTEPSDLKDPLRSRILATVTLPGDTT